jgi:DNA-binding NtrC family response regulator
MATILVVDDELGIRALLSEILTDEGHTVELAENAAQARQVRESLRPDLVLLDIWMPDVDGVTLLKEWSAGGQLSMPVIMMSGHGTIDTAVEATKFGASAFLEKPVTLQKLLRAVEQALMKPTPKGTVANSQSMGINSGTGTGTGSGSGSRDRTDGSLAYSDAPGAVAYGYGTGYSSTYGSGASPQGQAAYPRLAAQNQAPVPEGPQPQQLFDLDRPLREARDAFEKSYFEFHLAKEGGSMTRVAEKTGLERTHLYRKLKQLGVDLSRNKRGAV